MMKSFSFSIFISYICFSAVVFNPLNANPTKWSNTLKQFVGNWPTNCLSVFDHFVKLALKGLRGENLLSLMLFLEVFLSSRILHFDLVPISGNHILSLSEIMKSRGFSISALE